MVIVGLGWGSWHIHCKKVVLRILRSEYPVSLNPATSAGDGCLIVIASLILGHWALMCFEEDSRWQGTYLACGLFYSSDVL